MTSPSPAESIPAILGVNHVSQTRQRSVLRCIRAEPDTQTFKYQRLPLGVWTDPGRPRHRIVGGKLTGVQTFAMRVPRGSGRGRRSGRAQEASALRPEAELNRLPRLMKVPPGSAKSFSLPYQTIQQTPTYNFAVDRPVCIVRSKRIL